MPKIQQLVAKLLDSTFGPEVLATRLGVSVSTLYRWSSGKARPHAAAEGKIRQLAAEFLPAEKPPDTEQVSFSWPGEPLDIRARDAITRTLREVREILHRVGRLSSRHEALDELAKLLFAHVVSIDRIGTGISRSIISKSNSPPNALRKFVRQAFVTSLPDSLSHELKPSDFELSIRPSEERFAIELIDCFEKLAPAEIFIDLRSGGQLDLLNDTFGQFLADSFIDEKELGQYLTPTEVVGVMVRIGLQSLVPADLASFCEPKSKDDSVILDPSCGVGSFLAETVRVLYSRVRKSHGQTELEAWLGNFMARRIIGIDKSERMLKLAITNLALFGTPAVNLHLANSLVREGRDEKITADLNGRAKLILTNPPFGAEFSGSDLKSYRFVTGRSGKALARATSEVLFLERYIDWLGEGGVLVSIVPDSVLTNRGIFAEVRSRIALEADILSVVSLPSVTFGVAGTNTKTSILALRKRIPRAAARPVYFAVCNSVGYEVSTRGSHRRKVVTGESDLAQISKEACDENTLVVGKLVSLPKSADRWDANFHAGLPVSVMNRLTPESGKGIAVKQLAALVTEKTDPRRRGVGQFQYIEISDVDVESCSVRAKSVPCADAPSRARKLVRAGDVLISTVRPERRTIGVVDTMLDAAVCSTGFAVLRPKGIHPLILARLLQSDFANAQILRNESGISYPAVAEECILEVILPVKNSDLAELGQLADQLTKIRSELRTLSGRFDHSLKDMAVTWIAS